jgi:hypothetical protein
MTVGDVTSAGFVGASAPRGERPPPAPGETVQLRVLRQLDDHRYLVSLRDAQRVVSSAVPLTVGSTVRAVVTAVGEKLELRYAGADLLAEAAKDREAEEQDSIIEHARRYAVELQAPQRVAIEQAMQQVAEPQAMLAGGLFLGKLGLHVDAANLQALYAIQNWPAGAVDAPTLDDVVEVAAGTPPAALATQMLTILQESTAQAGAPDRNERERARRLLNEPDDSSVSYRFGVLPVLIADQLVELDIVHFRERRRDDGDSASSRRLVMTFSTSNLGRVEVVASALAERLAISITTDSPQARDLLAAGARDVRALVERLGWNIDSVAYDVAPTLDRAARHVIDHVLNGDTLSALL